MYGDEGLAGRCKTRTGRSVRTVTDDPEIEADLPEAVMPQEFTEFLIQLSIAVNGFNMYPPGHPSLEPALQAVVDRLPRLLAEGESLAIGVASGQLLIEGVATDADHPVLSDLARRFQSHQIGAISIGRGATTSEVEDACRTLSSDQERGEDPIGLLPRDEIPDWEHIHLYPLGYDRLELKDHGNGADGVSIDRATELWLGLARSAIAGDDRASAGESPTPQAIAESIRLHRKEEAYDQVIVGHLLQLAEELKSGEGEAPQIREQVSHLIEELDDSTLQRLVDMGGDFSQRSRFVLDASHGLAPKAVMKVLQAAATSSQQTISHSMTRLLTKLAIHSHGGDTSLRAGADTAFRGNVEELMAEWQLTDPNPDAYTVVLDEMARAVPILAGDVDKQSGEDSTTGAARIVMMSLEVDAYGPTVERAIVDLLEESRAQFLVKMIHVASGTRTARRIQDHLADPEQLRRVLAAKKIDVDSVVTIVSWMGPTAIDPLLETLTESKSRMRREMALHALPELGSAIWEGILRYLSDPQWFVIRNMLLLIQALDEAHEDFDATDFLSHPDPRVRRLAFPLAMRAGPGDEILAHALDDDDDEVVRIGLLELGESVPESILPILVDSVVLGDGGPEIRAFGIRTAGRTRSPLVLEALLSVTTASKTILGGPILAPKSMEVLAALATLARFWPDEARVAKTLKVARRSKDPEIKAAGDTS